MKLLQKKKTCIAGAILFAFLAIAFMNPKSARASDYASAQTLPLNGIWSSEYWLTDTDTEQWYKIIIPSDGKLTYKVMGYTDVCYKLYNEDLSDSITGLNYSYGSELSPDTDAHEVSLSKGVYYLTVYKGRNGKYKLNASFTSYHTNDGQAFSYDSPQTVPLGSTVTGALTATDTEDWYRFSVPASGYYHYQISAYTDVNYRLYNSDLSVTISGWNASYGSELTPDTDGYDVVLSAGTYYFKVYKGNSGKYTFSVSKLSQSACNHDYNTTTVRSTYVSQGYTLHQCSKCGHSYKDNYRPALTLNTPYLYSVRAGKKRAAVYWSSVSDATGYQISCKMKHTTKTVSVKSRTKKTITKLKSKKRYAFRVRAYKKVGTRVVYGKWSTRKTVKIK